MKKMILLFALLLFISNTYCQLLSDSTSKDNSTKAYYLQKSKNQRAGAWVLLIGGAGILTGTGLYASQNLDLGSSEKHSYIVPIGLSIACVVGSIPLFIVAGKTS